MLPHEATANAAVRAVYGRPVTYTGAGLDGAEIVAIRSDTRGSAFQGLQGRAPGLSFEVLKSDIPHRPRNNNVIVEVSGERWSVIDVEDRDDVDSWGLTVEEAPAP